MILLDLVNDELGTVLGKVDVNEKFIAALVCRRFRELLPGPYSTSVATIVQSVELFKLGHACGWAPTCTYSFICAKAAAGGHLDFLKWAFVKDWECLIIMPGIRIRSNTMIQNVIVDQAAQNGRLDVLKWARQKQFEIDQITFANAAEGGHLDVLKWANEHGCPRDKRAYRSAVQGGHLDVLLWLHRNEDKWHFDGDFDKMVSKQTCAAAAESGNLVVLKWLHEKGFPWDEATFAAAAESGNLGVIKWLRENGCPEYAT